MNIIMAILIILLSGLFFGGLSGAVLKSRSKQEVEEFNMAVSNFKASLRKEFKLPIDVMQRFMGWFAGKLDSLSK